MGEDKMFNRLSISKIGHVPAKGDRPCFFRIPSTRTTMGFRQAGVLAAVGFFLGIAFLCGLVPVR